MAGCEGVLNSHPAAQQSQCSVSGRCTSVPPQPRRRGCQRAARCSALLPEHLDAAVNGLHHLQHLLTLAYEPVVLPCSSMNCGDAVYRRWVLAGPASWLGCHLSALWHPAAAYDALGPALCLVTLCKGRAMSMLRRGGTRLTHATAACSRLCHTTTHTFAPNMPPHQLHPRLSSPITAPSPPHCPLPQHA
jgi:hypothetical protein